MDRIDTDPRPLRQANADYERDFYAWTQAQAAALRRADAVGVDWRNVAEEIESLGRNDRESVESHLETVIEHLLKLTFSPTAEPRRGWRVSVATARVNLDKKLTPTYRRHLEDTLSMRFGYGRRLANAGLAQDGVSATDLPAACPWSLEQLLDADFWPTP